MTYRDAVQTFKLLYSDLYERQVDYWTAQLVWTDYVDGLCRDGQITQRQQATWATPFTYGKRLSVRKIYSN